MMTEYLFDPAGRHRRLAEVCVFPAPLPHLRRERQQAGTDGAGHVERGGQQRLEEFLADDGRLVLCRRSHAGDLR